MLLEIRFETHCLLACETLLSTVLEKFTLNLSGMLILVVLLPAYQSFDWITTPAQCFSF